MISIGDDSEMFHEAKNMILAFLKTIVGSFTAVVF